MATSDVINEHLPHSAPKNEDGQIIVKANSKGSNIKQGSPVSTNEIRISLYLLLLVAVRSGDMASMVKHLDQYPEDVQEKDPSSGNILLHVAVKWGLLDIVKELVNRMREEDLEIETKDGLTSLLIAIQMGNLPIAECLVARNRKLISVVHKDHSLPVVYALLFCGQTDMVHFLYSATPPDDLTALDQGKHGSILLSQCILAKHFDIALHLMGQAPLLCLTEGSATGRSPVFELAAAAKVFPSGWFLTKWIYHFIPIPHTATNYVSLNIQSPEDKQSGTEDIQVNFTGIIRHYVRALLNLPQWMQSNVLELSGINKLYETKLHNVQIDECLRMMGEVVEKPPYEKKIAEAGVCEAMIEASNHGNSEFIKTILKANPELLWDDVIARRVFEVAIRRRDAKIFSLIYGLPNRVAIISSLDESKCNLLHKAALLEHPTARNWTRGSALEVQRDLHWFKEVQRNAPVGAQEQLNNESQKPWEVFKESHRAKIIEAKSWMRQTFKSYLVVAIAIATITSPLALTVSVNNQQTSNTIFLNASKVLASAALFSWFAVITFFPLLTSRYAVEDFEKSLPTKLILGVLTLFLATVSVIVALCVQFYNSYPGLGTAIAFFFVAGTLIIVLEGLQLPFLLDIVMSTYGPSIFNRKVKSWF